VTAHDHAARRDRLRVDITEIGFDAMYVTRPEHVRYLAGFTGSNGQLLVTREAGDLLITDHRYEERARIETGDMPTGLTRDPSRAALEFVAPGRLGFESDHLSHRDGLDLIATAGERSMEVVAVSGLIERLRLVKDDTEVVEIERACAITADVMRELPNQLRAGQTERDVAIHIERDMIDRGADGIAFASIVASGPNGAVPHHAPGDRRLEGGDLVTCDIGAMVGGYHADMTRTFAIGTPDGQLVTAYDVVRQAQHAGFDAVAADVDARAVDRAARSIVADAGYGDRFVHGTGHGVGLQIHESPWVNAQSADTLPARSVITVEPGIYLPGLGGIRIEDTVLVSAEGSRRLTDAPHDLLVV
jgi:Xaa-Pro aminopeptidase